jgi:glycosyltransferase involved in cell wall biosynthesis
MKLKKSIMHIAECPGGVDRYLTLLLPRLNDEFENILVCSQNYDVNKWKALVNKVEVIKMVNKLSVKNDFIAFIELRRIIKLLKPDFIYCHSSKAGALGRLANIGLCKNVIYNAHGWSFKMLNSRFSIVYLLIENLLSLLTSKIVNISDCEMKIALDKLVLCHKKKLVVIKNGIEIKEYSNKNPVSRKQLNIPEDAFVVGNVARLTYGKSPDFFIKVACKLLKENSNCYFIFIGDGEMKEEVISLAKEFEVYDKLIITGWISDIRQYISLLDVGVLFTRWEGFGYALAEYMLDGIPAIGTNVDSVPELIINGKNGYLIEVDNMEDAVNKLTKMMLNPEIRKDMGSYGNNLVKSKFNITRVVKEHRQLFIELSSL